MELSQIREFLACTLSSEDKWAVLVELEEGNVEIQNKAFGCLVVMHSHNRDVKAQTILEKDVDKLGEKVYDCVALWQKQMNKGAVAWWKARVYLRNNWKERK